MVCNWIEKNIEFKLMKWVSMYFKMGMALASSYILRDLKLILSAYDKRTIALTSLPAAGLIKTLFKIIFIHQFAGCLPTII